MHIKAAFEKHPLYPERFPLEESQIDLNVSMPSYNPQEYTSEIVLKEYQDHGDKGWADPQDISKVDRKIESYIQKIEFDDLGRPINPKGRTGLKGRGLLGKWGPNFAADPVVTRIDKTSSKIELLVIQRKDCLQWALPGGMIDSGESPEKACSRELKEEANVDLTYEQDDVIYAGYVDDIRNTDNAWMETTAFHKHISYEESLKFDIQARDDAKDVKWVEINDELFESLYASHADLVKYAVTAIVISAFQEALSKAAE